MQKLSLIKCHLSNLFNIVNKRKVPVILQFADTECGIASLAMIFSYFKRPVSLTILREKCGVSRDGCSAKTLIQVANSYGFKAAGYRVEWEDIKHYPKPFIAYWNFNHYVVISEANEELVKINDPAHGRRIVSRDEFDKSFTGVIIDIKACQNMQTIDSHRPLSRFTPGRPSRSHCHSRAGGNPSQTYSRRKLWMGSRLRGNDSAFARDDECRPSKWLFSAFKVEMTFSFLCLLVLSIIPYLNSILSRVLIDQVVIKKSIDWLPGILVLTLLLTLGLMTATAISKFVQFKLYSRVSLEKSAVILSKIFRLPIIFYSLHQRGEIIALFTRFEAMLNVALKNSLIILFGSLSAAACFLLMLKIDLSLVAVSMGMTALVTVILHQFYKINHELKKSSISTDGKLYSYKLTSIRNVETIKSCGIEIDIFNKWHALFSNELLVQAKIKNIDLIMQEINNAYYFMVSLSLLCLGAYRISINILTVGGLLSFYALHFIFTSSILSIINALKDRQSVVATNERVDDICHYTMDSRFFNKSGLLTYEKSEFFIEINKVSFFYNVHTLPTLNGIDLKIKQGEHIAFVGDTGSGKSSLAKLLCGFYYAHEGSVNLLGGDILSYSAEDLSKICAYVSQEVSLFSGNILKNITLDVPCNEDAIQTAITAAELQDLVDNRGLLSEVEECGQNFSGGEKQRIELARAIAQNTPLLILDEATSALDSQTEEKIIANLRGLQKTIIFIAHRLASIRHCDQICVLKDGVIVEKGTHVELMAMQGQYYSLVKNEVKVDGS
ncbi:MAG: peptidase domain-containing ABC transporter [Gammaproteobacteria bacterium]